MKMITEAKTSLAFQFKNADESREYFLDKRPQSIHDDHFRVSTTYVSTKYSL